MDKPLPAAAIARRRAARLARPLAVLALAAVALAAAGRAMRASVPRAEVRTAVVRRGAIAATLEAAGTVVPRREDVITSVSDTRVVEIVARVGDAVRPGDALLVLDASSSRLDVERLARQVALKESEREQARLDLERALADVVADEAVARLSLQSHEHHLANDRTLRDAGLVSDDAMRESEVLLQKDRIELERIGKRRSQARQGLEVRLQALDLERSILQDERTRAQQLYEQQAVTAASAGIVTWLAPTAGAAVRRGDEVARIADLSSFLVEATLSDVHASEVRQGQPATVVVAPSVSIDGVVAQVRPTVDDGTVRMQVALSQPSHPALRHKLRVDVRVETARRADTLTVEAASFALPDGTTAAWVVKGDVAVKTPVRLGLRNARAVEIASGLKAGDVVLCKDMSEFSNLKEVAIR